ncbi:hypothetical protein PB01_15875 [Psychrobacillus glaciei]|uniref:Uncharacterized protein n=1 Tax=Psychrobacillus glaciei TaxID=2283160 RepID=A0A5J6SQ97_9BACI|nr:hypothetical protein [Psychrobacillus glaciei]QFG00169.1 hypothetical protein PB01_15875 [Psychrobacillus glaciei]
MKYLYVIIILSILNMSGCSNDGSENDLKQENEQLKKENAKLLVAKEELEIDLKIANLEASRENDQFTNKVTSLQFENESHKEIINRYQKVFEFPISNNRTIASTLSIFSPDQVKMNNQIADLIVSDVKTEAINDATAYFIKFAGEFEVKGSIIRRGIEYSLIVSENLETMPHTLWQFEKGSIFFDIKNDEELRKSLGDKLDTLPEDGQLDIVGVFKNYSYNEIPESDSFPSYAEFVRLVSEN